MSENKDKQGKFLKLGAFFLSKDIQLTEQEQEVAQKIFDNGFIGIDRNAFLTVNGRRLEGNGINSTDPVTRIEKLESGGHMSKEQADKAIDALPSTLIAEFSVLCED